MVPVLYKSSTRIIPGRSCAEDVARVASESACVFPLLETCVRLKDSKSDCRCLTWPRYSCILASLASNSPIAWPMTNFESEKIRRNAPRFWLSEDHKLYKRSYSMPYLLCIHPEASERPKNMQRSVINARDLPQISTSRGESLIPSLVLGCSLSGVLILSALS